MSISTEKTINRQIAREYKNLLKVSYQTLNENDKDLIRNALDIAIDAHKDQYRKSGEPYIFHPISVAKIVAEKIGLDANSIAAALLHDVVEDSEYNIEKIKSVFGEKIALSSVFAIGSISDNSFFEIILNSTSFFLPRDSNVSRE